MRGHGEKKSRKMDLLIAALMTHPTVEAAAQATGIGVATAYRWLKDTDFLARVREARRDAIRQIMAQLQASASESVKCLTELQSGAEAESVRAGAAKTILEMVLKAGAIEDVNVRLDSIEQTLKQKGTNHDPQSGVTPTGKDRNFNRRAG